MTTGTPPHSKYRPEIDGLRAVAVIAVLLYHGFPEYCPGGFIGVDIFFVISGFLISTIIFESLERNSFSFREFYARRIRRIFPALAVVLTGVYGLGRLILFPDELKELGKHIVYGAGFASNILLWRQSGYFDAAAELKPLLHLWSLGIEEQFYIVWPLLLWACKKTRLGFFIACAALLSASFAANVLRLNTDAAGAFYLPHTRFWELMIGAALAWVTLRKHVPTSRTAQIAFSVAGFALIALSLALISRNRTFPGWWAALPTLGAAAIIAAGPQAGLNRALLSSRPAVWVGAISYPLYLWHWPLLSLGLIANGGPLAPAVRAALLVLSVLLAWATYAFVEMPVRSRPPGGASAAALMGAVAAVALLGLRANLQDDGLLGRLRERFAAKAPAAPLPDRSASRVMVLGDSHASTLVAGLAAVLKDPPAVGEYASSGCIPFYGVDRYDNRIPPGRCLNAMNSALELFERDARKSTIILSSMGPIYLDGTSFGMQDARVVGQGMTLDTDPSLKDHWKIYELGMRRTLLRLSRLNKNVIFVIDVPELGFDPRHCGMKKTVPVLGARWSVRREMECSIPRAAFDARTARFRRLVLDVLKSFPKIKVFDPTDLLCDQDRCYAIREGTILYEDQDHLSKAGSEYVAKRLAPLVRH